MVAFRTACTVAIFVVTLTLVLVRPRGYSAGWWAALGAVAMLGFRLVTPEQALRIIWVSRAPMLFLFALLLLSALLESSGFFEWAAGHAGRHARGDARRLFRNMFVLGALVTTVLSLDTTAVMLTPIVVSLVARLRLPARPYVIGTAFVANVASLTLPVGNLTNLLFAETFEIPFGRFARHMLAPQLVVAVAAYLLLRWRYRADVQGSFETESLAATSSAVRDPRYLRASAVVLALVLVGYFVAPAIGVQPYIVAFAGVFVLAVVGIHRRRVGVAIFREIAWGIFPLVLGLLVVLRAVENLGIVSGAADALSKLPRGSLTRLLVVSASAGAVANLMNNIPAALLARSVLQTGVADDHAIFGALIGLDVGPTILPTGSLATLLVLDVARRKGAQVPGMEMVKTGLLVTPLLIVLGSVAYAVFG